MESNKRILIIVESPHKRDTIREFLPKGYVVMASAGHITEIKDCGSYYNTGIDPTKNFKIEYAISKDKKDVVDKLKEQVKMADHIYLAADPDREGEAIAWSLKKFLKISDDKYDRITFHEITKKAVLNAIDNPTKIDEDLVDASQTRQRIDKMMGYRLSSIARKNINALSVGRCQSIGLKLVVDREHEILDFKPEKYFDLYLYFKKNKNEFKAKLVAINDTKVDKIKSQKNCDNIIASCTKDFIIEKIERKEKIVNPKPPFITSTFQQEVSSKLGIGVKEASSIAQKLFEGINVNGNHIALITYIRTDCPIFCDEFKEELEKFVKSKYGNKYYAPTREVKVDENAQAGHEGIRPVDLSMTPEKLSEYISDTKLLKVYEIIYNRAVATMMASQVISETIYTIDNNGNKFEYKTQEEIFDGFKKVYDYKEDKEEECVKEIFNKDEVLKKTRLDAQSKETKPPSRYTESTLVKELEKRGVGRPSTYPTIVSTILDTKRNYCKKDGKSIVPTELGMKLSKFLDDNFNSLINLNYTRDMEKDLDLIAQGKTNYLDILNEFYKTLEDSASKFNSSNVKSINEPSNRICSKCGGKMLIRTNKRSGDRFLGCENYPKCKHTEKLN